MPARRAISLLLKEMLQIRISGASAQNGCRADCLNFHDGFTGPPFMSVIQGEIGLMKRELGR